MNEAVKTPWHYWVVAVVSLLWNCVGAFDYTMTETRNAWYLSMVPPDVMAYVESFPAWAVGFWALGVWGAFAGSILLLMRSRWAVPIFAFSLVGLAGTTYFQYTSDMPASMKTSGVNVFNLVIWVIAIALFLYARHARSRVILR